MKYFVFKETVNVEGEQYPTFSICDETGYCVHDVTTNQNKAYELAAKFSAAKLSPIHLRDAVEDFLAE